MIIYILLGLSVINLLINILGQHRTVRKFEELLLRVDNIFVSQEKSMLKVEDDLNSRLRILQTSNFGPRMTANPRVYSNFDGDK